MNKYLIEFTCKDPESNQMFLYENIDGSARVFEETISAYDSNQAKDYLYELVPDIFEILTVKRKKDE